MLQQCSRCGSTLTPGAAFCQQCGAPVVAPQPQPYRPPMQPPGIPQAPPGRPVPQAPPRPPGQPQAAEPPKRKKKRILPKLLLTVLVLGMLGTGGYFAWPYVTQWLQSEESAPVSAAASSSPEETPAVAEEISSSSSLLVNNAALGLCTGDGEQLYQSVLGRLVGADDTVLHDGAAYYLNYRDGSILFVDDDGAIRRVSASGGESTLLRAPGHPTLLLAAEGGLYFVEDGLRYLPDGGEETLLVSGTVRAFTPTGDDILYLDGLGRLMRVPLSGGVPVQVTELSLLGFYYSDDALYLLGPDRILWRLDAEGPKPLTEAAATIAATQFVILGDVLYFTAPGEAVYAAPLDGRAAEIISAQGAGAFYLVNSEIVLPQTLPAAEYAIG